MNVFKHETTHVIGARGYRQRACQPRVSARQNMKAKRPTTKRAESFITAALALHFRISSFQKWWICWKKTSYLDSGSGGGLGVEIPVTFRNLPRKNTEAPMLKEASWRRLQNTRPQLSLLHSLSRQLGCACLVGRERCGNTQ